MKTKRFVLTIILLVGFFVLNSSTFYKKPVHTAADYRNATYTIEGEHVTLVDGVAETDIAQNSALKIIT